MDKICRPYKEAKQNQITQKFHSGHKAIDLHSKYGTFLVAPENCWIERIITGDTFNDSLEDLSRGYGIVMKSVEYDREHFYFHCLPIFPVNVGDIVKQGQIVAQMGNSGFVISGGKVVPIEDRLKPPFKGTHLHYALKVNDQTIDSLFHIDWNLPVRYNILDKIKAMINIFLKMRKLIN